MYWIFGLLFSTLSWACPNCGGSASSVDNKIIAIIFGFIAVMYVPMSILFKMAIAQRKTTQTDRNDC